MEKGNNVKFIAILFVIIILLASIIIYAGNKDISKDTQQADDDTARPVANFSFFGNAVNDFAFKIFKEIYAENEGNVFISPYSIFTALAMTYEGAKGNTSREMANVLSIEQDNESFHDYMKSLNDQLNNAKSCNVSTANALWVKEGFQLLNDYLYVIENYYGGNSSNIDFSNPVEAANAINQWVEEKTNNLIKNLLSEGDIDPVLTALILTNAIYFKGNWKNQFSPLNTTNRDFELSSGDIINVSTMKMIDTKHKFNYTETDDLQILELLYGEDIGFPGIFSEDEFSMVIVLPKDNDLSSIINSTDNDDLAEWINLFRKKEVDIYLPKFEFDNKFNLNEILKELGMPTAFTSAADFSGIANNIQMWIDYVIHQAYVKVNEEGTEAAAATAIAIKLGIEPKIVFNADHPFMFFIQHKDSGTILFMGTVNNPLE